MNWISYALVGAAILHVLELTGVVLYLPLAVWSYHLSIRTYGSGPPVILLHGGLGHRGNWGYQVPALVRSGYRAVLIDSRGHGRSTRDARPFTYELMASDVLAVMDALHLEKAGLVGWSDGACTASHRCKGPSNSISQWLHFSAKFYLEAR